MVLWWKSQPTSRAPVPVPYMGVWPWRGAWSSHEVMGWVNWSTHVSFLVTGFVELNFLRSCVTFLSARTTPLDRVLGATVLVKTWLNLGARLANRLHRAAIPRHCVGGCRRSHLYRTELWEVFPMHALAYKSFSALHQRARLTQGSKPCCRAASVLPPWNSRCKIELIFGVMLQFNVVWCIRSRREIVFTIQSDNGKQGYKVGGKKYCRPKVVLPRGPCERYSSDWIRRRDQSWARSVGSKFRIIAHLKIGLPETANFEPWTLWLQSIRPITSLDGKISVQNISLTLPDSLGLTGWLSLLEGWCEDVILIVLRLE